MVLGDFSATELPAAIGTPGFPFDDKSFPLLDGVTPGGRKTERLSPPNPKSIQLRTFA